MEKVSINGLMVENMMENGKITKCTATESSPGPTKEVKNTKVKTQKTLAFIN